MYALTHKLTGNGNALAVKVCLKRSHQYYIKRKSAGGFSKRVANKLASSSRGAAAVFLALIFFSFSPCTVLSARPLSFFRYYTECIQQCKTFIKNIIIRDVRWLQGGFPAGRYHHHHRPSAKAAAVPIIHSRLRHV